MKYVTSYRGRDEILDFFYLFFIFISQFISQSTSHSISPVIVMFLPLIAILLLLAFLYRYCLHPLFLSPLSKIPNAHFASPLSPIWILWIRFKGRENAAIYAAHRKYGPIVRLGPNEVSVNCVDGGIRTIYAGGFEKSSWYSNLFINYG